MNKRCFDALYPVFIPFSILLLALFCYPPVALTWFSHFYDFLSAFVSDLETLGQSEVYRGQANNAKQQYSRDQNSKMEAQLVLTRPESPVITIITTTSYNPSQPLSNHLAVSSCNTMQLNGHNGQYSMIQTGNQMEQQIQQCHQQQMHCQQQHQQLQQQQIQQQPQQQQIQQQQSKSRICRDFVRGSCRRLYCKVCLDSNLFERWKNASTVSFHLAVSTCIFVRLGRLLSRLPEQ